MEDVEIQNKTFAEILWRISKLKIFCLKKLLVITPSASIPTPIPIFLNFLASIA